MEIDYTNKRVLVVDDHPGMRSSIRATLGNFGVTRTDMASNALDATRRISQGDYDIIVSDYNLGEGRDGQQLLEELRLARLIQMSTVFLMVTAERSFEKVMTAAEVAPDDYLIKPFTAELLRQRLNRILQKKAAFSAIYQAMAAGKVENAIALCDRLTGEQPGYTIDAIRLKAELLNSIGHVDEAQALYEKIIALRAVPWARMGLAKSLFLQGKLAEAEGLLSKLMLDAPDFLSAHDLLARIQTTLNRPRDAQQTLQRAVERSPYTLARLKQLGEVALGNGEPETAERAFATVVEKGTHSVLRSPEDHARLARAQVDQGKLQQAGATLKALRAHFPGNPQAEFSALVVESLKEARAGHAQAAVDAVEKALALKTSHAIAPQQGVALDLARACLSTGKEEAGRSLVASLVHSNHEDSGLLDKAKNLFTELGRQAEGEELVREGVKLAVSLNNQAVRLAQQGDLAGAVKLLVDAATKLPDNVRILLNAAHAILSQIKQEGWNHEQAALARDYLNQAKQRDPEHPKLAMVIGLFRDLAKKYGVMT